MEETISPEMLFYIFVNSDPNITQTQSLTLKLTPNLTQTLILAHKGNKKSADEHSLFLFY